MAKYLAAPVLTVPLVSAVGCKILEIINGDILVFLVQFCRLLFTDSENFINVIVLDSATV